MAYRLTEDGSYVRSVRCGYCYDTGHNKSSCPLKKQNHKDQIAAYEKQIAEDNFSDDWERNYAQRNLDHHKYQLSKSVNRGKNRKCSFCSEVGHTRRTCAKRKEYVNDLTIATLQFREQLLDRMNEFGLGIGSLVNVPRGRAEDGQQIYALALVTDIKWEKLDHRCALDGSEYYMRTSRFIGAQLVTPEIDRWGDDISLKRVSAPIEIMMSAETAAGIDPCVLERSNHNYPTIDVLSPVESVDFPSSFLDESDIKKYVIREIVDVK